MSNWLEEQMIILTKLETFVKEISEMPVVRGVSPIEQKYNHIIEKAKELLAEMEDK
jgi:hypothetical protein